MSNLRKYLPIIILILLAIAASFGLGYLLRGDTQHAPIMIESRTESSTAAPARFP